MLGWRPKIAMRESMKRFFNYMRDAEGKKK
jgi:hypothetical protein